MNHSPKEKRVKKEKQAKNDPISPENAPTLRPPPPTRPGGLVKYHRGKR